MRSCFLDVNECFSSPCSHVCENSVGSFSCRCFDGYQLSNDSLSCIAADGAFLLSFMINSYVLDSLNVLGSLNTDVVDLALLES